VQYCSHDHNDRKIDSGCGRDHFAVCLCREIVEMIGNYDGSQQLFGLFFSKLVVGRLADGPRRLL